MVAILMLLTIVVCLTVDYLNERAKLRRASPKAGPKPKIEPRAHPVPQH